MTNKSKKKPKKTGRNLFKSIILPMLIKHGILAGSAFTLAALMLLLTMDMFVMPFYEGIGKSIDTPNLLGKTLIEAQRICAQRKLVLQEQTADFHNDYPENTIYLHLPVAGTRIKPGRNIRVFVSKGPRPISLPDVVGTSPRNARTAIKNAGLYVANEAWIPSNDYIQGVVASQDPAGGQDVADTTGVTLYISNGKKVTNIIMPNLLNLSLSAARDTLRAHEFIIERLQIQHEVQPDLLPDTVIDQYPNPGEPANMNDEVSIIVSKSEEPERDR